MIKLCHLLGWELNKIKVRESNEVGRIAGYMYMMIILWKYIV